MKMVQRSSLSAYLIWVTLPLLGGLLAGEVQAQSAAHEAVVREIVNGKTIKDAVWTSPSMLKVGVLDDGKPRDGLAMYVCEEIAQAGLGKRDIRVQIIDVAKLVRTDKWVTLGEANCK